MPTIDQTVYGTRFSNTNQLAKLLNGASGRITGQLWVQWDADSWMPSNWVRVTHANATRATLSTAVQQYSGEGVVFVINDGSELNQSPRQLISLHDILTGHTQPTLFN